MITDDEIKMIREIATASTPDTTTGLFRSDERDDQIEQFTETLNFGTGKVWCVCSPFDGKPIEDEALYTAITGNGPTSEANARFYSIAREWVLSLLDDIERLRREAGAK